MMFSAGTRAHAPGRQRSAYSVRVERDHLDSTRDVLERCAALGFAAAGVCKAEPSEQAGQLRTWLERGYAGTMQWMAEREDMRGDVRTQLDGARSVVMVTDLYARRGSEDTPRAGFGRVARYARGRDYHKVLKKRLHQLCDALVEAHPGAKFRAFVDTAPVMERELAARCGLGWQGKHTLTIHPKLGSWFLLGGIVTTLELPVPEDQPTAVDHCGTCTRCIDACPTGAIEPYVVDGSRCISYLTIEHREAIDPELARAMGDWIFGCDICQEVCPHNSVREDGAEPNPAYEPRRDGFDLLEVLGWSEEDRRAAFVGSAMKRAKLEMMRRNAAIAAVNCLEGEPNPELRKALERIAGDEDEAEMVRVAARVKK
jgi:epoxyqueuosine reductase